MGRRQSTPTSGSFPGSRLLHGPIERLGRGCVCASPERGRLVLQAFSRNLLVSCCVRVSSRWSGVRKLSLVSQKNSGFRQVSPAVVVHLLLPAFTWKRKAYPRLHPCSSIFSYSETSRSAGKPEGVELLWLL